MDTPKKNILIIRTFNVALFERKMELLLREFPSAHFFVIAKSDTLRRFPKNAMFSPIEIDSKKDWGRAFSIWRKLVKIKFDVIFYGYDVPGSDSKIGAASIFVDMFVSILRWKSVRICKIGADDTTYTSRILFSFRNVWKLFLLAYATAYSCLRRPLSRKNLSAEIREKMFINSGKMAIFSLLMICIIFGHAIFDSPTLALIALLALVPLFTIFVRDVPAFDKEMPDVKFFDSQLKPDSAALWKIDPIEGAISKKTIKDETRNCFLLQHGNRIELELPAASDDCFLKIGVARKNDKAELSGEGKINIKIGAGKSASQAYLGQKIDTLLGGWNDYEFNLSGLDKTGAGSLNVEIKNTDRQDELYVSYPNIAHGLGKKCNILLIVVDALRADHIGLYGANKDATPNIDEFFMNKIVFKNAFSQEIWTKPTFASMVTGLYPSHHQLVGKHFFRHLPEGYPLLAEVMKGNGYQTSAYMSHRLANQLYGYSRGFDRFIWRQSGNKEMHDHRDTVLFGYETLLNNRKSNNFVFLHIFDTHMPFFPRSPFFYKDNFSIFGDIRKLYLRNKLEDIPEEARDYYQKSYENKVREVDMFLGILFDRISKPGLRENTHVILTSDHGTVLFEKKSFLKDESYNLIDERVSVPLLVSSPNISKATAVDGFVESNIDIYPTVLEMAGIAGCAPAYSRSFYPASTGKILGKEFAVSELIYKTGYQVVVRDRQHRYHKTCKRDPATGNVSPQDMSEITTEWGPETDSSKTHPELNEKFRKIIKDLQLSELAEDSKHYNKTHSTVNPALAKNILQRV